MFKRNELNNIISEWSGWLSKSQKSSLPREYNLKIPKKNALALIGVRRCGKSFSAANLLTDNLQKNLCVNFEDPFFINNSENHILDDLVSVFTEYKQHIPQTILFDEIYHIKGWERWIRKNIDLDNYQIILTGSSAQMLSSELASSLTGRCLTETIWPLSFKEYLTFSQNKYSTQNEFIAALRDYMLWGGFPDVVLCADTNQKQALLQQYLSDILYKDIVTRYEIRSPRYLEQIINFYLTNASNLHSYNSVRKAFGMNVDTVGDYTRYAQMCFLLFEVPRYHKNLKVQSRDQKKIYIVDTGLRNANVTTFTEDKGLLAENIVYIELRRRLQNVYYFKEHCEVDFVTVNKNAPNQAIQVCYDNLENEKTRNREIESLIECLQFTGLKQGLILTLNIEETEKVKNKTIKYIPLYKWLLQSS
ncbi:MAG: ATP-binding protein [bacterium]|nr:ATP-binding protein [bacterium]MBU1916554.1 ATP-binding protein [bacterium]